MSGYKLPKLEIVNRALLDAIDCATDMVCGSRDGFKLDVICESLGKTANEGHLVFPLCTLAYPETTDALCYDGIHGNSWHEIADQWLNRFLNHVAAQVDSWVTCGPNDETGIFEVALVPPILDRKQLERIRIAYDTPRKLKANLNAEFLRVQHAGDREEQREVRKPPVDPSIEAPPGYDDHKLEERDRWIYEKRKEGKRNRQVRNELAGIFEKNCWRPIISDQGIREALNRYCLRTGARPLPSDKGGRPKKKTPK